MMWEIRSAAILTHAINRTLNKTITSDLYGITSLEWGAHSLAASASIPAAIANAVHAACGLRLRAVPFTRDALEHARAHS